MFLNTPNTQPHSPPRAASYFTPRHAAIAGISRATYCIISAGVVGGVERGLFEALPVGAARSLCGPLWREHFPHQAGRSFGFGRFDDIAFDFASIYIFASHFATAACASR